MILALKKWRQEDQKFRVTPSFNSEFMAKLGYLRPCLLCSLLIRSEITNQPAQEEHQETELCWSYDIEESYLK